MTKLDYLDIIILWSINVFIEILSLEGAFMPFSIDFLSIKSESQKVRLSSEPPYMGYSEMVEPDKGIFEIEGLVEQEPITIF